MAIPVEDVVAENLIRFRKFRGVSQEQVAHAVREIGLPWSRSVVAAIEGRARRVSLSELLTLAWALGAPVAELLTPHDDDLNELDTWIELAPGLHVRGARQLLDARELPRQAVRQWDTKAEVGQPDLADRLAAEKLGVTPAEIDKRARQQWGTSLTAKRDNVLEHRLRKMDLDAFDVSTRAPMLQALRGHITRELYSELIGPPKTKSRVPKRVPRRTQ